MGPRRKLWLAASTGLVAFMIGAFGGSIVWRGQEADLAPEPPPVVVASPIPECKTETLTASPIEPSDAANILLYHTSIRTTGSDCWVSGKPDFRVFTEDGQPYDPLPYEPMGTESNGFALLSSWSSGLVVLYSGGFGRGDFIVKGFIDGRQITEGRVRYRFPDPQCSGNCQLTFGTEDYEWAEASFGTLMSHRYRIENVHQGNWLSFRITTLDQRQPRCIINSSVYLAFVDEEVLEIPVGRVCAEEPRILREDSLRDGEVFTSYGFRLNLGTLAVPLKVLGVRLMERPDLSRLVVHSFVGKGPT